MDQLLEKRFIAVKIERHVHVLASLSGEHEHNRPKPRFIGSREHSLRIAINEGAHGVNPIATNKHAPVFHRSTSDLKRVSHVGKIRVRVFVEITSDVVSCCL